MKWMIFTHCENEREVRRFFVSRTERNLYKMLEVEISHIVSERINDGSYRDMSLRDLYNYVENRWYSLDKSKFKDFVYVYRLLNHMKDYCDVCCVQAFGKFPTGLPQRMKSMSEPLTINRRMM